ncbi:MAG: hypothetical protein MUC57_20390 [Desulfobacterales bacterium]|nr:hypothetical protein [Desulfobacterales bacterium]
MGFQLGPRRGVYVDIAQENQKPQLPADDLAHFEQLDLMYRSLCAMLYNYVPMSGHPGGSISSGRMVAGIVFDTLDYDMSDPDREEADILSYAAGHKTLGLYAMWALRNEVIRIGAPELLPKDEKYQLRLEDLLGFRRNPLTKTPLFLKGPSRSTAIRPRPPRFCAWPRERQGSVWRHRSAWLSVPWIITAAARHASTSSKGKGG